MSTSHGVIQGYNAQALVDEKHQIIVHGAASGKGQDNDQLEQIMDGAKANMEAIGKEPGYFEGKELSADSNYHSNTNLKTVLLEKLDAYIPDNLFRKRDSRFKTRDRHKPKNDCKTTAPSMTLFRRTSCQQDPARKEWIDRSCWH